MIVDSITRTNEVKMNIGDLVKLTNITSDKYTNLRGIILSIDKEVSWCYEITWTDGDLTWEFGCDLEAVCK
jgi:hypothetical protein